MQRISVNLTNDSSRNQFNYDNDLTTIGNKNYALQKPFKTYFLSQLSATRNCNCYLSFVKWPKASDFILQHIFLYKIICNN